MRVCVCACVWHFSCVRWLVLRPIAILSRFLVALLPKDAVLEAMLCERWCETRLPENSRKEESFATVHLLKQLVPATKK